MGLFMGQMAEELAEQLVAHVEKEDKNELRFEGDNEALVEAVRVYHEDRCPNLAPGTLLRVKPELMGLFPQRYPRKDDTIVVLELFREPVMDGCGDSGMSMFGRLFHGRAFTRLSDEDVLAFAFTKNWFEEVSLSSVMADGEK